MARTDIHTGEPLCKRLTVRVFLPEGHNEQRQVFKARPGRAYTPANVEEILDKVIDHLDMKFVHWEFRMVKVGPCAYNFMYAGLRAGSLERTSTPAPAIEEPST